MSLLRKSKIKNGDTYVTVNYYSCDICGREIYEADSYYESIDDQYHLCADCAFKEGLFNESEYLSIHGIHCNGYHAAVKEGKIVVWHGKKAPWEKTDKDYRHSMSYKQWRLAVFERDNYTCQDCGQHGGTLNAHHIKTFKDYPDKRFVLSNGITLCTKCHRLRHKRKEVSINGKTSKRRTRILSS